MALLDIPKSVAENIVGQACTLKLVSTSSYLHYFVYLLIFFSKERGTSTEPPPRANFSATANQVELEYTPYHYYTKIHCNFVTLQFLLSFLFK